MGNTGGNRYMKFWDNVKKFAQPYADEEYDDYEDEEMEGYAEEEQAAPRRGRRMPPFGGRAAEAQPQPQQQPAADYADAGYGQQGYNQANYTQPNYTQPNYTQTTYTAPAAEQRSTGFNGTVLNMNSNKHEVVLFHAKAFDDAAKAADELMSKRAVILNMENVDKAMTRRVVDFLSGCVYALGGKVKKVAQSTYLFCPHSMDIVGDLESLKTEPADNYI
jgi:cell division inhibitor SepF